MSENKKLNKTQQIFDLLSKNNELEIDKLLDVLRFLGHNISEENLNNLKNDKVLTSNIKSYEELEEIRKEAIKYETTEKEIRKSFEYFDKQKTGFISVKVLEQIFKDFENNEVRELIRLVGEDDEGRVNYESFLRLLYDK